MEELQIASTNEVLNDSTTNGGKPYPSVVDRYFTRLYKVNLPSGHLDYTNFQTNRNDVKVLLHSNKICVLTLAPTHPALACGKRIADISYRVSLNCNRANSKVSGKRKRGAQWLNPESPLCIITMEDGQTHTVNPGIRGNLIEVNEKLRNRPELLQEKSETNGYIAVIMVKLQEHDRLIEGLMTEAEYEKYITCL